MTDPTNEMNSPWAKCEHGSFKHLDGITPCYKCHPEFKLSDTQATCAHDVILPPWDKCRKSNLQAKSREIEQILIDCKDGQLERTVGLIMSILEAERTKALEEAFKEEFKDCNDSSSEWHTHNCVHLKKQMTEAITQAFHAGHSLGMEETRDIFEKSTKTSIDQSYERGYRRGKADQWDKMKKFFDGTERNAYLAGLEEAVCLIEEADRQGLVIEEMVDHLRAKAKELK